MKKNALMRTTILAGAAVLALGVASVGISMPSMAATPNAQDKKVPVTSASIDQKVKFVTNLVSNSAASRTIDESGDKEAKAALENARKLVEQARQDHTAGKFEAADGKLNQAISAVMTNTRRITESTVKSGGAEAIYQSRVATVKAMLDAFQRVADEKSRGGQAVEKKATINKFLKEAEGLAAQGNYEQAVTVVDRAYASVTAEVASLRDGEKLVKTLKFDTPKDEYVYELDRNDSHFFLLKLTVAEKNPDPMVLKQVEEMRVQAQQMRDGAEDKGKKNDYKNAIDQLGKSTTLLIKALRTAGAYIPG